jgi:hypothetical protein
VIDGVTRSDPEWLCETLAQELSGQVVTEEAEEKRIVLEREFEQAKSAVQTKAKEIRDRKLRGDERQRAVDEELTPLLIARDEVRRRWLSALQAAVPRAELALGKSIDCTEAEFREYAEEIVRASGVGARDTCDLLAAFGSDACLKLNLDRVQPTPFCFITGAGHQFFLDTARKLMERVSVEKLQEALFRPWLYVDETLSMRWDPIEDRRYALMDRDPTAADNKARTVWMANLLAYRALVLFATSPTVRGLGTTAWGQDANGPFFAWPLWEASLSPAGIRSLLQLQELVDPELGTSNRVRATLRARGIAHVFRSYRIRTPPSGANYRVNFSPAVRVM